MKTILKFPYCIYRQKRNYNSKVYYQYTIINIQYINTFQVRSLNITLFNIFLKIYKLKTTKQL